MNEVSAKTEPRIPRESFGSIKIICGWSAELARNGYLKHESSRFSNLRSLLLRVQLTEAIVKRVTLGD